MRRTTVETQKRVESAEIGLWRSPVIGFATPYSLVPFVKSREDIEVVLRQHGILVPGQPIELSGFSLHRSLRLAMQLQSEPDAISRPLSFQELVAQFHIQISWPCDLLWSGHSVPLRHFRDFVADSLPLSEMALATSDCARIADKLHSIAARSPRKYLFWRQITKEQSGAAGTLSRLLLEASIAGANRARAHSMAGIVPCIDLRTPNSLTLQDSYNVAYAHVIDDRLNQGLRAPAYLYTVALNSTMVREEEWPKMLDGLTSLAASALDSEIFEGIHLSFRGFDRISARPGRVAVAKKIVRQLRGVCDAHQMPLMWSRSGLAGLAGRDAGVQFASYRLNLQVGDVYPQPGGVSDRTRVFGRVMNPIRRVTWSHAQVVAALQGPDAGMPDLGNAPLRPTPADSLNAAAYRVHFSKPYNMASFRYLDDLWRSHVQENETHPGREYLQSFEAPYNHWGLR